MQLIASSNNTENNLTQIMQLTDSPNDAVNSFAL